MRLRSKNPIVRIIAMASFILAIVVSIGVLQPVSAQGFSGSDVTNYYCLSKDGYTSPSALNQNVPIQLNGNWVCQYICIDRTKCSDTGLLTTNALPKPPQLRQIEIWIVRILYVLWAFAGIFFTIVLMYIGFLYLTSFGNEVALKKPIEKFRNWLIGLALVFLSYPVLNTFFNILPLDTSSTCYADIQTLPGFQFFFPDACLSGTGSNSTPPVSCVPGQAGLCAGN